jgi:hypothetical protein
MIINLRSARNLTRCDLDLGKYRGGRDQKQRVSARSCRLILIAWPLMLFHYIDEAYPAPDMVNKHGKRQVLAGNKCRWPVIIGHAGDRTRMTNFRVKRHSPRTRVILRASRISHRKILPPFPKLPVTRVGINVATLNILYALCHRYRMLNSDELISCLVRPVASFITSLFNACDDNRKF